MTISFISNYLIHHQVPIADELSILLNGNFYFIETHKLDVGLKNKGYPDFSNKKYLIQAWKNEEMKKKADIINISSDVVVYGLDKDSFRYMIKRVRLNKLSFEMSERWFKRGWINLFSPRLIKNMWYYHTQFYNKQLYKLCNGAFVAQDQRLLLSFKNKCFKWGYFTSVSDNDLNSVPKLCDTSHLVNIMWCAKFVNWKRPDLVIKMAKKLKQKGYLFKINMYGNSIGTLKEKMIRMTYYHDVNDVVSFCGVLPNEEIRRQMTNNDIFICTSTRREGWGAVVYEAMSEACAVVSSDMAGSTHVLIKDGYNGLCFKSGDIDSLTEKVEQLIDNPNYRIQLSKNAYNTIKQEWSPQIAAQCFIKLAQGILNNCDININQGPCSIAY